MLAREIFQSCVGFGPSLGPVRIRKKMHELISFQ